VGGPGILVREGTRAEGEEGSSTNNSKLSTCSGLLGRDLFTLLKLSRRLTGMREVPGMFEKSAVPHNLNRLRIGKTEDSRNKLDMAGEADAPVTNVF